MSEPEAPKPPNWLLDEAESEPDSPSELTQAQIAAAINWLRLKWGAEGKACPYCETNAWIVSTPVYLDVGFGLAEPGWSTMSPVFPVMCENCGNTVFINAYLAGILAPPEVPDENPDKLWEES